MEGEEASLFVLTDGENFATLLSAQDHKNIFDGDKGKILAEWARTAPRQS